MPAAPAAVIASMTPPQAADAYGFPAGTDGTGQTVAIIELGGGYSASDLATYFSSLGVPAPAVTAVSVDGAVNSPGQPADAEVMLDIEVVGSVSPGAAQLVYFAPNTEQGLTDAISDAAHASERPTAISVSWGQSEDTWSAQGRSAIDAALADAVAMGVTATTAAGDRGSSDGVSDGLPHLDFPASSPHALACGGTRLMLSSGAIAAETVWNDADSGYPGTGATGGGVSDVFALPSWQGSAGVPPRAPSVSPAAAAAASRGVPDVAGNADPATGYEVFVNGQPHVYGGTSAVAPLWAALIARLAEAARQQFGLVQPLLYAGVTPGATPSGFRDITSGSNGAYSSGPGWDPCTGLGSADGAALLKRLTPGS
jgi:kumamolisin